jgi:hypothetical protein
MRQLQRENPNNDGRFGRNLGQHVGIGTSPELHGQGAGKFQIPVTYTATASGGGPAPGGTYSLQFLPIPSGKTQLTASTRSPEPSTAAAISPAATPRPCNA